MSNPWNQIQYWSTNTGCSSLEKIKKCSPKIQIWSKLITVQTANSQQPAEIHHMQKRLPNTSLGPFFRTIDTNLNNPKSFLFLSFDSSHPGSHPKKYAFFHTQTTTCKSDAIFHLFFPMLCSCAIRYIIFSWLTPPLHSGRLYLFFFVSLPPRKKTFKKLPLSHQNIA